MLYFDRITLIFDISSIFINQCCDESFNNDYKTCNGKYTWRLPRNTSVGQWKSIMQRYLGTDDKYHIYICICDKYVCIIYIHIYMCCVCVCVCE